MRKRSDGLGTNKSFQNDVAVTNWEPIVHQPPCRKRYLWFKDSSRCHIGVVVKSLMAQVHVEAFVFIVSRETPKNDNGGRWCVFQKPQGKSNIYLFIQLLSSKPMNLSLRLLRHRESPGKDQSVQERLPQCGSHVCYEIMYCGREYRSI